MFNTHWWYMRWSCQEINSCAFLRFTILTGHWSVQVKFWLGTKFVWPDLILLCCLIAMPVHYSFTCIIFSSTLCSIIGIMSTVTV